jgi:pimeloyl-ACP methyl ester carboxylesterase
MTVAAEWPERVVGLALVGATAEPVGVHALGFRGLAAIYSLLPDAFLDRLQRVFFLRRYPPAISAPILAAGFWYAGGVVALRSLIGERFKPRLAAYPGPTLLINGEYDVFFRPGERAFAAVAADPRRALIRRATHLANLDQPARFTAAIRRFAEQVGGISPLRA